MRHVSTSLKNSELYKTSTPKRPIDLQNPPEDRAKFKSDEKQCPSTLMDLSAKCHDRMC
jgi:hypothetical protein